REGDRGAAALEFLHVDPRVVAALNGAEDDPAAATVEKRDRRRLVAARPLVGVVADDRDLPQGFVDSPVDAGEPGRDLVDRPVEIVDPGLQRDGEIDEIVLRTAKEHLLRWTESAALDTGRLVGGVML